MPPTLGQISQVSDVSMNQPVKSLVNANSSGSSSSSDLCCLLAFQLDRVTTTAAMSYTDTHTHSACKIIRNTCKLWPRTRDQLPLQSQQIRCLPTQTLRRGLPARGNFIKCHILGQPKTVAPAQTGCPHPMPCHVPIISRQAAQREHEQISSNFFEQI